MNRIKKDGNYVQNLVEYAKRNIQKGYAVDSLRWALINQGHSRIEVDKALATAQADLSKERVASNRVSSASSSSAIQPSLPTMEIEPEAKPSFWKRMFG